MVKIFLQDIIEDLRFEDLPANWNSFDLDSFSKSKKLWDYQKDALKNAIKVLWRYFEDFVDYQEGERLDNRKELAFKLKISDKPFALIKIGDVSGWLKNEFAGYEVQERFEDKSYFERY